MPPLQIPRQHAIFICPGFKLFVQLLHSADFKGELFRLHRELLAGFLELLRVLTDRPSLYARQVGRYKQAPTLAGLVLSRAEHG